MSRLASIADRVPYMKPGHTLRNVVIGGTALVAFIFLPFVVVILAFIVPILLVFDVRGLRTRLDASPLSRLPGLADDRSYVLAVTAFIYLLLVSGMVGVAWPDVAPVSNNTTALNETSTPATTPTPTPTASSHPSNLTPIESVHIVNTHDVNGDGRYESFALRVSVNTTVRGADSGAPDDPGEPFFRVVVNGEQVTATGTVERTEDTTVTIPLNASVLPARAGELNVTIRLMDLDFAVHDTVASESVLVPYAPVRTPTPTPTATPTPTPTPTPTATPTQVQNISVKEEEGDDDDDNHAVELYVAKRASESLLDDRDYNTLTLEEEKARGWEAEGYGEGRDPNHKDLYNESDERRDKPESLGDDYDGDELIPEKEDADGDGILNGEDKDSPYYTGDDSDNGNGGGVDFGGDDDDDGIDFGDGNLFD